MKTEQSNKNNISPSKSSDNSSSKSLTEEKAISLAFSQMVSQHSAKIPITMDKNQLFETFLLFQNFLNMNQIALQNTQPNQLAMNKSLDEDKDNDVIKEKEKENAMETISHRDDSGSKQQDTNRINNDISRNNNNATTNDPMEQQHNEEKNSHNFDDIPIKPSNANFMELVEKTLANDNSLNSDEKKNNPKKKIVKAGNTVVKKNIQISKPSKNDKKYSYYTDTLEDNNNTKPIEDNKLSKTLKTDHSSLRHSTLAHVNRPIKSEQRTTAHQSNQKNSNADELLTDADVLHKNPKKLFIGVKAKKIRKAISNDYQSSKPTGILLNDNNNKDKEIKEKEQEKLNELLQSEIHQQQPHMQPIQPTPLKQYIQFKKAHIEESKKNSIIEKPKLKDTLHNDTNTTELIPEQNEEEEKKDSQEQAYDQEQKDQPVIEKVIETKINELNLEIFHFKEEKEKVDKLKDEYEKLHSELQKDIDELNSKKVTFEDWKNEETKKIQKEKKKITLEMKQLNSMKQTSHSLQLANKKDKEVIDGLKSQLTKLQNESKQKENTSKLIIDKLKKQIDELTSQKDSKATITLSNQPNQPPLSSNTSNSANSNERTNLNTKGSQKMVRARTGKIEPKQKQPIGRAQTNTNTNTNTNTINLNTIPHSKEEEPICNDIKIKKQPIQSIKPNKAYSTPFTQAIQSSIKTNDGDDSNEKYDFILPDKYHSVEYHLINQETSPDGKIIRMYNDDKREVIFQSGVRKEIFNDGYQIVYFSNGDLKQVFPNNKSVYYFKEAKTVQTIFNDGHQVFKFNNGQIEKHFTDGTKRISFPDGSIRNIFKDGKEETYFADGTIQKIDENNIITIEQVDGLKVIKYPDGKEECIYLDDES